MCNDSPGLEAFVAAVGDVEEKVSHEPNTILPQTWNFLCIPPPIEIAIQFPGLRVPRIGGGKLELDRIRETFGL